MGEWERLAFNSFKFHLKLRSWCVDSPVGNTETTVTHTLLEYQGVYETARKETPLNSRVKVVGTLET